MKKGDGIGPFYDSNKGPDILPPDFRDTPTVGKAIPGTYLHFYAIPTWDVSKDGTDYLIVGDTGISWGYLVTPEPTTLMMAGLAAILIIVFAWYRHARILRASCLLHN